MPSCIDFFTVSRYCLYDINMRKHQEQKSENVISNKINMAKGFSVYKSTSL